MKADISVRVDINGEYGYFSAGMKIDEPLYLSFKPMWVSDEPILCYATGDLLAESELVRKVVQLREDAAEQISKTLTEFLINAMESQDTVNGYPVIKNALEGFPTKA